MRSSVCCDRRREEQIVSTDRGVRLELRDVEPSADAAVVALAQPAQHGERTDQSADTVGQRVAKPQRLVVRVPGAAPRSTTPPRWSARTTVGPTTGRVLPKPESDT